MQLDLGDVREFARVFVNGREVAALWAKPYRCDIAPFAWKGDNEIKVEVTSTWFNRLVFDAGLQESERKTWTISAPEKGMSPKKAGLLGPVTLRR